MGLLSWLSGKKEPRGRIIVVAGDGQFSLDVVGESNYQATLAKLTGGPFPDGCEIICDAALVPEPDNPHDRNAVKVIICGALVGYLDRTQAEHWSTKVFAEGVRGAGCPARIRGGWDRGKGDRGNFGVRLDVSYPITAIESRWI